ncbi:hypothetical protein [Brevundimonas sp. NPDC058933]|uniref:hypothetical protein n=1 Tax=Brevundimonas sp. NPDC058933 TaxID=3346673 RepID=UPI003BEF1914
MSDEDMKEPVIRMIRTIMEETGWSASRLAREAQLSPSTITRALDPNSAFVPSRVTVSKLMPLLEAQARNLRNEVASIRDSNRYLISETLLESRGALLLAGGLQAGVWLDGDKPSLDGPPETIPVWDSGWPHGRVLAFKIGDDATHDVYKTGVYVFTVQVKKDDDTFKIFAGDEYVLRRRAHFHGSVKSETSIWRYVTIDGETKLKQTGGSPGKPEFLKEGDRPDWGIDIVGKVVGFYDRRPWRPDLSVA